MIRRPPRSTLFPTRRSSDLAEHVLDFGGIDVLAARDEHLLPPAGDIIEALGVAPRQVARPQPAVRSEASAVRLLVRSEEHTSELQSRNISYAVFCLKKKT